MGIALFLTQLAERELSVLELRKTYPNYFISKNKIELKPEIDVKQNLRIFERKIQKRTNYNH